jgi:hypothetical protein
MIEPARFSHVDDFGIRISEQGNGFQQTHFHSQSGDRYPKMLMKETIQMTPATAELGGQFPDRRIQEFIRRKLLEDLQHVLFDPDKTGSPGLGGFEFDSEDRRRHPQQLASVVEVELRRNLLQKPMAFHGHAA